MVLSNKQISNTFHFTFSVGSDALKDGVKIRNVVPSTEEEARRILDRMDAEGLFDWSFGRVTGSSHNFTNFLLAMLIVGDVPHDLNISSR